MNALSKAVRRYDRNTLGRDFVVGDIHGCFDQLRQALDGVAFSPTGDRLFSVGDLIDRGPQSAEALEWLARPWFHACIGNHEDMALQSQDDPSLLADWVLLNGGEWWMTTDAETRIRYLTAFRQLPIAMEILTQQGRVGIVHADIPEPLGWPEFVAALESGDASTRWFALWSRRRADGLVRSPVEGIDQVVFGHTITPDRRVHRLANTWFIDTGAFLADEHDGHLTLLPLERILQGGDPDTATPEESR